MNVKSMEGIGGIMLKKIPNIISLIRIIAALMIIETVPLSKTFYILYTICGILDMADGYLARKLKAESDVGARLDSIADLMFFIIVLLKLIPELSVKNWIWFWIFIIFIIRVINIISGYIKYQRMIMLHTYANKVTGLLLFLSVFGLGLIKIEYIALIICIIATFASVQEGYYIKNGKTEV